MSSAVGAIHERPAMTCRGALDDLDAQVLGHDRAARHVDERVWRTVHRQLVAAREAEGVGGHLLPAPGRRARTVAAVLEPGLRPEAQVAGLTIAVGPAPGPAPDLVQAAALTGQPGRPRTASSSLEVARDGQARVPTEVHRLVAERRDEVDIRRAEARAQGLGLPQRALVDERHEDELGTHGRGEQAGEQDGQEGGATFEDRPHAAGDGRSR